MQLHSLIKNLCVKSGRRYFKQVAEELKQKKLFREARAKAIDAFIHKQYHECISIVDGAQEANNSFNISSNSNISIVELLVLRLKCFYQLNLYKECIKAADYIIGE